MAALSNSHSDSALCLYKLRESTLYSVHRSPGGSHGGGTALTFSNLDIHRHHAAVGMQDGTILLWDTSLSSSNDNDNNNDTTNSLIMSLEHRHSNSITELVCSPIHKLLLASSSLDGSIAFHDIHSHQTIQTIQPPLSLLQPLPTNININVNIKMGITCLGLHADGVTCAAGTSTGHVLLYDLRKNNQHVPLATHLLAPNDGHDDHDHDSNANVKIYPVKSLQFQHRTSPQSSPKRQSSSSSSSSPKKQIQPTQIQNSSITTEAPASALKQTRLFGNGSTHGKQQPQHQHHQVLSLVKLFYSLFPESQ